MASIKNENLVIEATVARHALAEVAISLGSAALGQPIPPEQAQRLLCEVKRAIERMDALTRLLQ